MTNRLEYRHYRRRFQEPVRSALGVWSLREGFILRMEDDDGLVGFGEVAPIPCFGTETLEEAEAFLAKSSETGLSDEVPVSLPCCRFAISCARSVLRQDFNPPETAVEVAGLLPPGAIAQEKLLGWVSEGFRVFKWKVGVEPFERERGVLDTLVAALPTHGTLRLDANGGWNLMEAWRWLDSLHGVERIEFLEDPLEPALWEASFGLAEAFDTPLALDLPVVPEVIPLLTDKSWSGLVTIKPSLVGAVDHVLGLAGSFPHRLIFSSAFETAFGYEAILRLASGAEATGRVLGMGGQALFEEDGLKLHPVSPSLRVGEVSFDVLKQAWEELP